VSETKGKKSETKAKRGKRKGKMVKQEQSERDESKVSGTKSK
jgi:hypothetical protein